MGFLDRLLDAFTAESPQADEEKDSGGQPATRMWTNHAGGYFACSHTGCQKKVDGAISDHDCCGRCWPGRDCKKTAVADYGGPGAFFHRYSDSILNPGICIVCGETQAVH